MNLYNISNISGGPASDELNTKNRANQLHISLYVVLLIEKSRRYQGVVVGGYFNQYSTFIMIMRELLDLANNSLVTPDLF